MKVCKSVIFGIVACALVLGVTSVTAAPPPPPPGMHLAPGMTWCPRCGGHGRVPSGFLGWSDKRCPECKGYRMVRLRHAPMPPAPAPALHHHAQPAPAPVRHHAQPAPVHHQPVQPVPTHPAHGPARR